MPEWLRNGEYYQHITVGKIENEKEYQAAILDTKDINDVFETIVNKVSVENIDSIIEMEIELK